MLLEKASQTIDSESRRRASDTATFAKVEPLLEISREAVLLEGKELAKPNALFQFYARQLDTRPNAFTRNLLRASVASCRTWHGIVFARIQFA